MKKSHNITKAVILAGGLGTRLAEETIVKPKPMVEIGGKPILWHIIKLYSFYGINEFFICCGYKQNYIKQYFHKYFLHVTKNTYNLSSKSKKFKNDGIKNCTVHLINTGNKTMTGGRLKKVYKYVKNEKAFCFTYGDGLSNININKLILFHLKHNKLATLTAIVPPIKYGVIKLGMKNFVKKFQEKPEIVGSWINGGFFVLDPKVIGYIKNNQTVWEEQPLKKLVKKKQLLAYKHKKFWMPMDTLRDKIALNKLWNRKNAPWKIWK